MEIIGNPSENLIPFLIDPPSTGWLLIVKIIFILFSLALIGFTVFALSRGSWLKFRFSYDLTEFLTYRPFGVIKIEKDWKKIAVKLDMGLESEYKLAVIEADNIFNETLKRMGYAGESLGEKLEKITPAILANVEEIKEAHQVRNNIVHDPNYKLSLAKAKRVLEIFEKALKNLDVF